MIDYVLSFAVAILLIANLILGYMRINNKLDIDELNNELIKLDSKLESPEFSNMQIEYTNSMLKYIHDFTIQVASIEFRNFMDGHDLTKVTKATMSKLVEDTAIKVDKSIYLGNIKLDDLLFTKDFYNNYIIDITMISIKELLDKAINISEEV